MIVATAPTTVGPTIREMKERHHEMMRRLVAGDRAVDICKDMGVTQSWFSIVQASPVFQLELTKLRELANQSAADVSGRLQRLAPDAMTVLENAIRGKKQPDGSMKNVEGISEKDKVNFAKDVIEYAGHSKAVQPTSQAPVTVQIVQFTSAPQKTEVTIEGERVA